MLQTEKTIFLKITRLKYKIWRHWSQHMLNLHSFSNPTNAQW